MEVPPIGQMWVSPVDQMGYPLLARFGYPCQLDGGTPPREIQQQSEHLQLVCLLRSRRRTFLLLKFFSFLVKSQPVLLLRNVPWDNHSNNKIACQLNLTPANNKHYLILIETTKKLQFDLMRHPPGTVKGYRSVAGDKEYSKLTMCI